jgi:drug/metabolite transporter (DMT)-like permease
MPLLQTFIAQGSEGYLVHNVPLWFVSCLFVIELAYYWIAKLPDVWNVVLCVFLAVAGYLLVNKCTLFDFTTMPWSVEVAMMAMIFYATGNLLVKHIGHHTLVNFVLKRQLLSLISVIVLFSVAYR